MFFLSKNVIASGLQNFVGPPGIEPKLTESKSVVLPLHHRPMVVRDGLEPSWPDFQSGAMTIFATSPK
jgi:hypothetical protein